MRPKKAKGFKLRASLSIFRYQPIWWSPSCGYFKKCRPNNDQVVKVTFPFFIWLRSNSGQGPVEIRPLLSNALRLGFIDNFSVPTNNEITHLPFSLASCFVDLLFMREWCCRGLYWGRDKQAPFCFPCLTLFFLVRCVFYSFSFYFHLNVLRFWAFLL